MRRNIEEINQISPELPNDGAKEFAPLPDEFNRDTPTAKTEKRKPSSIRKIMLYIASIGVVTLGIITPITRVNPPETNAVAVVSMTPSPAPAATPKAGPIITPAATVRPTAAPTPRMTGQIHITIYSEVFDLDTAMRGAYPSTVLADETLAAETFTEYPLPPLPEQDGYEALGYVLLKSGGTEYLEGLHEENTNPAPIGTVALTDTLTADDLEIVPKDIQGVYNAEIHVVWLTEKSDYRLEFYDGDMLFGDYYIGFPIESEQLCYLAPFPKPARAGKTFVGWQNVDGFMVDAVTYYDFFEKLPNAKTIGDRNLKKHMPCKVYACWSDGSGGAPEPTPGPTATPPEHTVSCSSRCGFSKGGSGGSRTLYEGQSVTIYARGATSTVGYFLIGGQRIRVSAYDSDGVYQYFKYRIIVRTTDLKIDFKG